MLAGEPHADASDRRADTISVRVHVTHEVRATGFATSRASLSASQAGLHRRHRHWNATVYLIISCIVPAKGLTHGEGHADQEDRQCEPHRRLVVSAGAIAMRRRGGLW